MVEKREGGKAKGLANFTERNQIIREAKLCYAPVFCDHQGSFWKGDKSHYLATLFSTLQFRGNIGCFWLFLRPQMSTPTFVPLYLDT